jgi:hypothetical protein
MQLKVAGFSHVCTCPPAHGVTSREAILRVTAVRNLNLTFIISYCVCTDGALLIFLIFVL